jgi:hypothetical protein
MQDAIVWMRGIRSSSLVEISFLYPTAVHFQLHQSSFCYTPASHSDEQIIRPVVLRILNQPAIILDFPHRSFPTKPTKP